MKRKRSLYNGRETRSVVRKRTAWVVLFFILGFGALIERSLHLHLIPDRRLERLAKSQHQVLLPQVAPRGTIFDARGEELAVSVPTVSLAVRPSQVDSPHQLAAQLNRELSLPKDEIYSKLTSKKKYLWLKRNLTPREAEKIKALEASGLEWVTESKRYYPNRDLAGQILGAVGIDGQALGGIELAYQSVLVGDGSPLNTYRDARGEQFELPGRSLQKDVPYDLSLTLNKSIQYALENELSETCRRLKAKACTGIVLDPRSGAILGMSSYPTFNPNAFGRYEWSQWKNKAITDGFEPGSIFKVVMAAAALETETVKPEDRFFCENGSYPIGRQTIHDHEPYGLLSFREIMKVSSNIGFYKIGQRVGKKSFSQIIHSLGFGEKSGIDFPGEEPGLVRPASEWRDIDFANIAFGQGVRVTPLQILRAFSVIASGGYDVKPHFVNKVTSPDGQLIWQTESSRKRILKPETAKQLTQMLIEVTEEGGTGNRARIPGYTVAGKTGTAQKFKGNQYSHTDFMSSFIGFVPAENPRVAAIIVVDEPRTEIYGGLAAAPAFRNVSWVALRELGVSPQGKKEPFPLQAGMIPNPFSQMEERQEPIDDRLPDFRGLTLREVLGLLEKYQITAELEGSGIATTQTPLPGTKMKKGEICRILFRSTP